MPRTPSPQSPPTLLGEQSCNGIWPHPAPIPSTGPVTSRPNVVMSTVAPIPCPSEGHSGSPPSPIIALQQQSSPQVLLAPLCPATFPSAAFSANNSLQAQIPSQQLEILSSRQHPGPHKKSCPVEGCRQLIAPTMWRLHMALHAQGFFPGAVPGPWLQEQDLFICPGCQQLVANSHHSSHLRKCSHTSATPSIQSPLHVQGADPTAPLPTFDSVCQLPGRTVRHIPVKDRLAFALALCSALRCALHDNSEDAWLKVFMLPKCLLLAQSVKAAITNLYLSVIYAPGGPMVSAVHYGIEHPVITPLVPVSPLTTILQLSRLQYLSQGLSGPNFFWPGPQQ